MFKAVKSQEGKKLENSVNISSYGPKPYNLLSPFTYSSDFQIPVPGQTGIYANSVESIWQGLKMIDGNIDFELFTQKPKKRKGQVDGHLFNGTIIDVVNARKEIYKPSYFYYLKNYVDEEINNGLLMKVFDQWEVYLYDVENNLDIKKPEPLAHSVFACEYLNSYLNNKLNQVREKIDVEYNKKEFPHETLAEPISRAVKLFKESPGFEKKLATHFLRFNGNVRDVYHARYYVRLFEKLERLQF